MYDVASPTLFHSMKDDETKFDPVAVRVSAELPAVADEGLIEVNEGTGLGFCCWVIVNSIAPEVPPPGGGLVTVTEAVAAFTRSGALICAVSVVELT